MKNSYTKVKHRDLMPQPSIIFAKKTLLLLFISFFGLNNLHAEIVDAQRAEEIAKNFYISKNPSVGSANDVRVSSRNQDLNLRTSESNYFHIFNIEQGGFVIVAADDVYEPIIGFSTTGAITSELNTNLLHYMQGHRLQLDRMREVNEIQTPEIRSRWNDLQQASTAVANRSSDIIVAPLTTTDWMQEGYYNDFCPEDPAAPADNLGHVYTGCVTVAMAQLMKYHNHPAQGNGYKYYNDDPYGYLWADYGSTTYNWENMPDTCLDYNDDVAQLQYHVATSILTEFSATYTGAYTSRVPQALIYHFGYDNDAKYIYRGWEEGAESWMSIVKSELDVQRPVIMTGVQPGSSHAWVIDGYDSDDYFRMNWGWGDNYNGWFIDNGEYWEHDQGNDTNWDITFYTQQAMVYQVFPAYECQTMRTQEFWADFIDETSAYIWANPYMGQALMEFRYRRFETEEWTYMSVSTNNERLVDNLLEGTAYEFQVRYQCSSGDWADFTESYIFTTLGTACAPVDDSDLTTSSIGDSYTYIYTTTPFTASTDNQFRYRIDGSGGAWLESTISDSYFRFLDGLVSGTTYEFQARHECNPGNWTGYSESQYFTTTGEPGDPGNPGVDDGCETPISADIQSDTYYTYFFPVNYAEYSLTQFRWKPSGGTSWNEGPASIRYYRRVKGMGIAFEETVDVQVRFKCPTSGEWTNYSNSYTFTSADNL